MRPCEFQGVILCGPGEELYPLTQHAGSVYKSLLPVCNQPLVEHPLKLLEQLGLTDVLILCQSQREADDLSAFIRRRGAASNASLTKVEVWATETSSQPPATATPSSSAAPAAPEKRNGTLNGHTDHDQTHHHHTSATDEGEEYESTAGALRWASHQGLLKSDFVLLPCDLCLAKEHVDATLGALLDRHRRDDCLMSTLLVEAPEDSKAKGHSDAILAEGTLAHMSLQMRQC